MTAIDKATDAYIAARKLHADLYHESAEKWYLGPVRVAVGKAYDAMMTAQRSLIDTIGEDAGRAYVLALNDLLRAKDVARKSGRLFNDVRKQLGADEKYE